MSTMLPTGERRACQIQGAYALAVLYTIGYLGLLFSLMLHEIPPGNREVLLTLVGIMSAAQLGIIKHYYDGTKVAESAQLANIVRASRSDEVIQEMAKAAPPIAPAPIKTDNVQVDATNVSVSEKPVLPITTGEQK